jgi:integrase/recombinase XerD
VGDAIRQIVADWVEYLLRDKFWGFDDPLFPATQIMQDANRQFAAVGIARKHYSSAAPIRVIFMAAFGRAGLPYFNPHSVAR